MTPCVCPLWHHHGRQGWILQPGATVFLSEWNPKQPCIGHLCHQFPRERFDRLGRVVEFMGDRAHILFCKVADAGADLKRFLRQPQIVVDIIGITVRYSGLVSLLFDNRYLALS